MELRKCLYEIYFLWVGEEEKRSKKHSVNNYLGLSYWTIFGPPAPPPPMNFVHGPYFPAKLLIITFYYFRVRLSSFLGRALRLGRARGPSAAARGPGAAAMHGTNDIHVIHIITLYKIDRRGGPWGGGVGVQISFNRKLSIT